MLASVLRLSGLDRRLAAFKLRLDEKASEAADHIKAVVVRMFVAAALAVAAAVFALLALIAALVALYGWLEPTYGVFPALSIVGGVLALTALVLISAAMIISRGRPISEKGTPTPKTIEVPPSSLPLSVTPAPIDSVDTSPSAASAATAGDKIEPFLSVVKRYAHLPRTGRRLHSPDGTARRAGDEGGCHARGNARSQRGSRHNARRSWRGDGGWLASGQGSKSISRRQPLRP